MFRFKLKIKYEMALLVLWEAQIVALDPFVISRGLLATYSIKIHSHERCKKAQQTERTET
jgi:hypothetical protein